MTDREERERRLAEAGALLRRVEPPPAEDALRAQQIERALSSAQHTRAPVRRSYVIWALAGACVVALLAFGVWRYLDDTNQTGPGVILVAGTLAGKSSYEAGQHIGTEAVTATAVATLRLGDGSMVELEPATRAQLAEAAGWRIVLAGGRASVHASHQRKGRHLRVRTPEAVARVVGTRFEVTRDARRGTTVRVSEGIVEVTPAADARHYLVSAPEGMILVGLDGRVITAPARDDAGVGATTASDAAVDQAADSAAAPDAAPETVSRPQVAQIRRQIRGGRIARARSLIRRGRRAAQGRRLYLAELAIVEAEAFLAEKRYSRATASYLAVERRYRGTPQAEAALFAAAQLAIDHQPERAPELLQRYLRRYPRGRFASDATRLKKVLERSR